MGKSEIDCDIPNLYTWSPVTGCPRGCSYCVVRNRVWPRIKHCFGNHDYNKIVFHPDRMDEPAKKRKPVTYFVGFYSDHEYWDYGIKIQILNECQLCYRHTFMFLSKNPIAYCGYIWPKNTMKGLTMVGTETKHCQHEDILEMMKYSRSFLSIEPLLGTLKIEIGSQFERVIVGAQTGPGSVIPENDWIDSIRNNVPANKIFWKDSIKKYL